MKLVYTLLFVLSFAANSGAKPITFTFESQAEQPAGWLSGVGFFSSFVITAKSDTSLLTRASQCICGSIELETAEITIPEHGTFQFEPALLPFHSHVNVVGSDSLPSSLVFVISHDLLFAMIDAVFSTWDMSSSLGSVSGTASWTFSSVQVGLSQDMYLLSYGVPLTFTATVTPEPSSFMLAAGTLLLLTLRWR